MSQPQLPASSEASNAAAHRNFYDAYAQDSENKEQAPSKGFQGSRPQAAERRSDLLQYIRDHIIGKDEAIDTPFGVRQITYADYTASGRSLSFIEDYIRNEVLPLYANTHTLTSTCGLQTTMFRNEAREIVKRNVRGSKDDVVFFTGSGATGGVCLLMYILNLKERAAKNPNDKPVVFVGPYEHHSNLLPWRETGAEMVTIKEGANGGIDLADLEAALKRFEARSLKIGTFSAASNISGILTDTLAPTALMRRYGCLSFWDYAAAAPYTEIDMNPSNDPSLAKDAIFLSPHKFVGGPGTPGVLVVKKSLLLNFVPSAPGGGTVFFVGPHSHRYLQNFEEREEGGTPDIIGAIRAGLVFQLKEAVGVPLIHQREQHLLSMAMEAFNQQPNLVVLGHPKAARLPILSFMIKFPGSELFLHSNFVSVLLNDLFGIQSRAGCLCAGPYAQNELGMDVAKANAYESSLLEKNELVRPGFVRLNLNYFLSDAEARFLIQAVAFVAEHGYKLLPQYGFYVDSGEWKHRSRMTRFVGRRWLSRISYAEGRMSYRSEHRTAPASPEQYLALAHEAVDKAMKGYSSYGLVDQAQFLPPSAQALRWFALPSEALSLIKGEQDVVKNLSQAKQPLQVKNVLVLAVEGEEDVEEEAEAEEAALEQKSETAADVSLSVPVSAESTLPASTPIASATTSTSASAPAPASASASAPAPACCPHPHPSSASSSSSFSSSSSSSSSASSSSASASSSSSSASSSDSTADFVCPLVPRKNKKKSKNPAWEKKKDEAKEKESKEAVVEKEDICKNCFHIHWGNDLELDSKSQAIKDRAQRGELSLECLSCPCVHFSPKIKTNKKELQRVETKLRSVVGKAIMDYGMIKDGDRVLVGVSGGKDSLSLVHMLLALQKRAPIKFEIGCATVDPQTPEYDPSILKVYFKSLGIPYFYESQAVMELAGNCMDPTKRVSICSFCSRMKRGILYSCCRREGYNVLALGQHLDDLAESFFMSAFHNGFLRTMKANYYNETGDVRIIRPLAYCRERLTREFAKVMDLPVINENCPACYEAPKERARVKLLLASQEHLYPNLFQNLLRAMEPLMSQSTASSSLASTLQSSSRAENPNKRLGQEQKERARQQKEGGKDKGQGQGKGKQQGKNKDSAKPEAEAETPQVVQAEAEAQTTAVPAEAVKAPEENKEAPSSA